LIESSCRHLNGVTLRIQFDGLDRNAATLAALADDIRPRAQDATRKSGMALEKRGLLPVLIIAKPGHGRT